MKKLGILALTALTILGAGFIAARNSFAQTNHDDPMSSLVQRLADRFGLNKDDVQQVFNEEHEARHKEMQELFSQRLEQAVTDEKITETQKQAIISKHDEMKNEKQYA
jgi:hypothetical protein